jgi:hypothetical protein
VILRRAAALLIGALSLSAATIDEVFPLLHPIDPTAPFAFHQWPQKRREFDNYGMTFAIWPDRATLFLDEKLPLTTQLRTLSDRLPATKAARRLRVRRWNLTAAQCPAIPKLFETLHALPPVPVEFPPPENVMYDMVGTRQDLFVNGTRYATGLGWRSHQDALQNAWVQLDACSKHVPGRRVRAR